MVPIPSSYHEQEQIAEIIRAMEDHSMTEKRELHKLQNLKSGLMSDLLTGRVPVQEAINVGAYRGLLSGCKRNSDFSLKSLPSPVPCVRNPRVNRASMALTESLIAQAVERDWREYDRYAKLAEFVGEACQKLLDENVIRGSVQWRAKNPECFRAKLQKAMTSGDHETEFVDLDSVFHVVKDLAGVRITTYVESDREKAVEFVQKRFNGTGGGDTVVPVVKDSNDNFYRATHCIVQLKPVDLVARYQNLEGLECEVQVCSLLAHVYNEIEHDLRYKPLAGALSAMENGLLNALGQLTASGDTIVNLTLDAVEGRQLENQAEFEDEYDFVARMRRLFPDAETFATNAGQLYEACVKLGLDSPQKIKNALSWQDGTPQAGKERAQQLADVVNVDPATQLDIDPLSSDQLLVLLLADETRVEQLKRHYPSGRGIGGDLPDCCRLRSVCMSFASSKALPEAR